MILSKKDDDLDIKTKTKLSTNSIFVEAFQVMRTFPARPNLNYYDRVENRIIKPSLMLKAHLTCIKQIGNLPREILKIDKNIKFDNYYSALFKKNYKFFGYNLYLEENISKTASNNKIKKAEKSLFKKYGTELKQYLRISLFENPCIIKSEKCKYLNTNYFVTIYYDQFTDLFAIVDSKQNYLLDFGIATKIKYAEIFAYQSCGMLKASEICLLLNQKLTDNVPVNPSIKSPKSKELEVYKENYVLSRSEAIAILDAKYCSNFIAIENSELKIDDWKATKKIEHATCFGINPESFGFSQDLANKINAKSGIVRYLEQGNDLPSLDLNRAFQNAIKNFF